MDNPLFASRRFLVSRSHVRRFALGVLVLAAGQSFAAPSAGRSEAKVPSAAREEALEGQVFFDHNDFQHAAEHFEKALQLAPSWHQVQFNLALSYEAVGKLQEARDAFKAYEPYASDAERPAVEQRVAELDVRLQKQQQEASAKAAAQRQEARRATEEAAAARQRLELQHRAEITAAQRDYAEGVASAAWRRKYGWIIGGAGLASFAAGGVLMLLSASKKSSISTGGFATGSDIQSAASTANMEKVLGYGALGAGGAALATGIVFEITGSPPDAPSVSLVPRTSGGMVVWGGSW